MIRWRYWIKENKEEDLFFMELIRIRKVFVGGILDDLEIVIWIELEFIGGGGCLSNIIWY